MSCAINTDNISFMFRSVAVLGVNRDTLFATKHLIAVFGLFFCRTSLLPIFDKMRSGLNICTEIISCMDMCFAQPKASLSECRLSETHTLASVKQKIRNDR